MAKRARPVDVHVGSQVRIRRQELGMSQESLGDAIGLTFQQVQKYEKGTNRMGSSRLHQVANVLRVPISYFFEGAPDGPKVKIKGTAPSPDSVDQFAASEEGLALAKAFSKIKDPAVRRSIAIMVNAVAGPEN